jgi:hypothetical protein
MVNLRSGSIRICSAFCNTDVPGYAARYISVRDLRKISGEAIGAPAGLTSVKSGDRTAGLLILLKAADLDRLVAVLARVRAMRLSPAAQPRYLKLWAHRTWTRGSAMSSIEFGLCLRPIAAGP